MNLGLLRRGGVLSGVKSPAGGRKATTVDLSLSHLDGFPETVSGVVSFGTLGRRVGVRDGEVKRNSEELSRNRESGVARGVISPKTCLLRGGVEGMLPAKGTTLAVIDGMTATVRSSSSGALVRQCSWLIAIAG